MGILNLYNQQTSPFQANNNPSRFIETAAQSKLHNLYSINGDPFIPKKPQPSALDLEGKIPENNYRDNTPEGASF